VHGRWCFSGGAFEFDYDRALEGRGFVILLFQVDFFFSRTRCFDLVDVAQCNRLWFSSWVPISASLFDYLFVMIVG
jgi:hypothetical protein